MPRSALVLFVLLLAVHAMAENCVVNKRLPLFALGVKRKASREIPREFLRAPLLPGTACYMSRLARVQTQRTEDPTPIATYSTQMCTRSNNTHVSCAMLAQNDLEPHKSTQHLHHFTADTPGDAVMDTTRSHGRKSLCSSCERKHVSTVMTRLLRASPILQTAKRQLGVGVPQRISTARLVASQLHRDICGANRTCPRLQNMMNGTCKQDNCLHRKTFLTSLFARAANNVTRHTPQSLASRETHNDLLWNRNWVFCAHKQNLSAADAADATERTNLCKGSVPKSDWLNHKTRSQKCAAAVSENFQEDAVSINFCLLNTETQNLCRLMKTWQQKTEKILCEAAGDCPVTDFFYTPTTFNMQEQEFVHTTVLRFYEVDAGRICSSTENAQGTRLPLDVKLTNIARLNQCSSTQIEPLLIIVEQFRTAKRMAVLIAYHGIRVCFRLAEVFVASFADSISIAANTASNAIEVAASRLLNEIVALMQVIGNFIDHLASAVSEIALSRGVGGFLKEMIYTMCVIVEWIYNNIWAKILCHVVVFVLELAGLVLQIWKSLVDVMERIGIPVDDIKTFIKAVELIQFTVREALNECEEKDFECALEPSPATDDQQEGALPMPTRCWSTYISFYGDNQRLSCTRADTCLASSLGSDLVQCGACEPQSNPGISDFACDYLTQKCTCAVPRFSSTECLVNEDCWHKESVSSCRLLNEDLLTSRTSVPCDECNSLRICYHSDLSDVGVCACGVQMHNFQQCSAQQASQQDSFSLMLNNLCLYTPTADKNPSFVAEFAQTSVIACQKLVPSEASCALLWDYNVHLVRGYRSSGRRLLASGDRAPDSTNYTSVHPACLDALVSDSLPHTRASCQALFDSSSATLALLGLARQLPPCALCSFDDALDATRRNPLAVFSVVSNPHTLSTVLRRHGPLHRFNKLFDSLHLGVRTAAGRISAANAAGLVTVERGADSVVVHVDDTVIPPPVARALEAWVSEVVLQSEPRAAGNAGAKARDAKPNASHHERSQHTSGDSHPRRLLLFQELVLAVEERVRQGWLQADRLHEAFAQSVTQILTYQHLSRNDRPSENDLWFSESGDKCDELSELLRITMRASDGILQGWLTLTHRRDELQSKPAETLSQAWPKLIHPTGADALPAYLFEPQKSNDLLLNLTTDAVNATLDALNITPSIFYDLVFSAASIANTSFTCPYEAVQTCSSWRVRLWHGFIIIFFYFSIAALSISATGLSFVSSILLANLFPLVLAQLCYGYTWTCVPMIPVCAWQDFTESVNALLPLSLDVPDDLKKTGLECRDYSRCLPSTPCLFLHRYPAPECLKSCRDPPFAYTSASSVLAWGFAEIWLLDPRTTQYALNKSHHVPFFDHAHFNRLVKSHIVGLRRAGPEFNRAQRFCAGLSAYLLIPYLVLLLFAIAFLSALIPLLAAQLYPFLLLVFSLFTAASADAEPLAYDKQSS